MPEASRPRAAGRAPWWLAGVLAVAPPIFSDGPASAPSLGLILDGPAAAADALTADAAPRPDAAASLHVRLTASWERIEREPGVFEWSELRRAVDTHARAGDRVVLALGGAHPLHLPASSAPSPLRGGSLDAWLRFVRSAAATFAGTVDVFEVGDTAWLLEDAQAYSFLLKSSALALRAETTARGAGVRVAQAALPLDRLPAQTRLWELDVAAYIDVMPVRIDGTASPDAVAAGVERVLTENLRHPPAAAVWAYVSPSDEADDWRPAASAVRALTQGLPVALVTPPDAAEQRELWSRWARGVQATLSAGFAPAPLGEVRFEDAAGRPLAGARALGAFLSDETFTTLIFYSAPGPVEELPEDRLIVDTSFVQNAQLLDPPSGAALRVGSSPLPRGARGRAIRIARAPYPRAVLFQRPASSAGFELPPEAVETTGTRELTAEEIIARHQQVQKLEDDRLERWIARGRIDYHFKLAQGGSTIDVAIDANYFWERGGQLEWEETGYYINGNRVRWKNFPELPLIQPEKVITLPLDLTLDKSYRYRRVGREAVEGRDAYVLEFQPHDPEAPASLYRGRVWIDAETFQRVKASLIQTQLESPVLSNEEVDRYAPRADGAGNEFWLLDTAKGQQIWSTAGRSFVVRREVSFVEYRINPATDEFQRARAEAYASSNKMMRDTESGYRYLRREPDGTRSLKDLDTSRWFAAAGAFEDSSSDGVTPLAGVNYFNYDLGGRNIQINALFAGVVGFFTGSKPDVLGGKASATVDAGGSVIFFQDTVFLGDDELEEEAIDARAQNVSLRLGVPAGQFLKFNVAGGVSFRQYDDNDDGEDARAAYNAANPGQSLRFELPENHQELRGTVELEFNRRGYTVIGSATWARRTDWETWGLFDDAAGTFVRFDAPSRQFVAGDPEPVRKSFGRWGVTAFKEWYLPRFQKVRGEVNYLGGRSLDRFSTYQFSLFGDDRLNGFSGTGVRFEEGWIARAGYSFNLFEAIRFDAVLENAWVEDRGGGGDLRSFAGAGIAATVVGPWKTVINASYGRALSSDIPDLEGENEFLLLILKLF